MNEDKDTIQDIHEPFLIQKVIFRGLKRGGF
jgi:Holliday junction resolvasome RuvABC ATP-dependent DNA helicase subunit